MQGGEASVGGGLAASGVGAVHHIIVDKGACLQELQRGRGRDGFLQVVAASTSPTPVAEGWPQPFAAREQTCHRLGHRSQIGADSVQRPHLGRQEVLKGFADPAAKVFHIQRGTCEGRHMSKPTMPTQGRHLVRRILAQ